MRGVLLHGYRVRKNTMTWQGSFAAAVKSSAATSSTARTFTQPSDDNIKPRSRSPHQTPRTAAEEENVYVLTLITDQAHHNRMTALRNKYFPPHLNKLAAHLTLFHALPASQLDSSIIPIIEAVANNTRKFDITARKLVRLGKGGIGIVVPKEKGGAEAKDIRNQLQAPWKRQRFLSRQDAGPCGSSFPHYTVMNKVDDEAECDRVEAELRREFLADEGMVEGLGLYLYDKGWWRFVRRFDFVGSLITDKEGSDT